MKITDKSRKSFRDSIDSSNISVGTVFRGRIDKEEASLGIYLMTCMGIVNLRDPIQVWVFLKPQESVLIYDYEVVEAELILTKAIDR